MSHRAGLPHLGGLAFAFVLSVWTPPRAAVAADWVGDAFPVIFDSEWIRLYVIGDSLEVRGTYILRCQRQNGTQISLSYPFPQDSLLGGARMVSLHARVDGNDRGEWSWKEDTGAWSVRWQTPPCTGDTITMEAVYRQRLLTSYARYVVTSTRKWLRPIRCARFEIHLPAGAVPSDFSYPFEARGDSLDRRYTFEADSFYPDRDIVVRWSRGSAREN